MIDERPVHIYVLLEDWSDEVRYVGQTVKPKQRFREHLRIIPLQGEATSMKRAWIERAHERGITIRLRTIEICTREKANEREAYWVQYYLSKGHRLTNGTETGGSGTWRPNPHRKRQGIRPARMAGPRKERAPRIPTLPVRTPEEILALWMAAWDGYRAVVDDSMFLARPHHDKIEAVRDYLADKPALAQDLETMRRALPGDYPMFRVLTKEEWLEKAAIIDAEEALLEW